MPGGTFIYSFCPASRDGPTLLEIQEIIPFIHFLIQQPFNKHLLYNGHCPGVGHPNTNNT